MEVVVRCPDKGIGDAGRRAFNVGIEHRDLVAETTRSEG
jgi:hypothetical protein